MEIKKCIEILEISENAPLNEIREAYRDLISIWHPDKYHHNERLYKKALKKTKEINVAFETIEKLFESNRCEKNNDVEFDLIVCKKCSTKNRVPKKADKEKLFCGKCGYRLYEAEVNNSKPKKVYLVVFGGARFGTSGIEYKGDFIGYDNILKIHYHNVRRSLNGMPMSHEFGITMKLKNGKNIKLLESTDIQPAITKIPISKIFNSKIRRDKKQEIIENVQEIKKRFIYSLAFLEEFSKVELKESLPWL